MTSEQPDQFVKTRQLVQLVKMVETHDDLVFVVQCIAQDLLHEVSSIKGWISLQQQFMLSPDDQVLATQAIADSSQHLIDLVNQAIKGAMMQRLRDGAPHLDVGQEGGG